MPKTEPPKRVLFICNENCNRSQMAEAFARIYGARQVEASSAGHRPAEAVHPKAIAAMREFGYDMQRHYPKTISAVPDVEYDVVVTMGSDVTCPVVNAKYREEWKIPCPKAMPPEQFRAVRDQIKEQVQSLIARLANDQSARCLC